MAGPVILLTNKVTDPSHPIVLAPPSLLAKYDATDKILPPATDRERFKDPVVEAATNVSDISVLASVVVSACLLVCTRACTRRGRYSCDGRLGRIGGYSV